jgi:hypothetical protein
MVHCLDCNSGVNRKVDTLSIPIQAQRNASIAYEATPMRACAPARVEVVSPLPFKYRVLEVELT